MSSRFYHKSSIIVLLLPDMPVSVLVLMPAGPWSKLEEDAKPNQ